MIQAQSKQQPHSPQPFPWRSVLGLIAIAALVRIALLFILPYELVGDEAHYWEWSRRLELSYYSKGPAVAYLIAGSNAIFGEAEWAVRFPAVLCGAALMFAMSRLGWMASGENRRAAMACAGASLLVPAYHATALLMTIDGPLLACWAVAAAAAWCAMERWRAERGAMLPMCVFGGALGLGFLAKYTMLLIAPCVIVMMVLLALRSRHRARCACEIAAAAIVFASVSAPVFVWNARHGWPTFAHLLGHLGVAGGDLNVSSGDARKWSALWPLEFIGAQIGLIGPVLGLMALAALRPAGETKRRAHARRFLIACAAPILLFYLAVSFVTDTEGNWPIAGYVTLLVLVGVRLPQELARWRADVRAWRKIESARRPRAGILRRRPETWFQILFHWSVAYGLGGLIVLTQLVPLSRVPRIGRVVPIERISGHKEEAERIEMLRHGAAGVGESLPPVIADRYDRASLLAYYLPGRPRVWCASRALGDRESAYDYFADTQLADAHLNGETVILVGSGVKKWARGLELSDVRTLDATIPAHAAFFEGLRTGNPDP